jgi:hypothetical protein
VLAPVEKDAVPIYVVLNGAAEPIEFVLPEVPGFEYWTCLLATAPLREVRYSRFPADTKCRAQARSVVVFAGIL